MYTIIRYLESTESDWEGYGYKASEFDITFAMQRTQAVAKCAEYEFSEKKREIEYPALNNYSAELTVLLDGCTLEQDEEYDFWEDVKSEVHTRIEDFKRTRADVGPKRQAEADENSKLFSWNQYQQLKKEFESE
jgi:hypothetical protein